MLFIIRDASDEFWWKLMTHEALYYAFYYVTVRYPLATNLDPVIIWDLLFIQDWLYFEAIEYVIDQTELKFAV